MSGLEKLLYLNQVLLNEMPEYKKQGSKFPHNYVEQRRLLRSLMNVRPPMPLDVGFLKVQDEFHFPNDKAADIAVATVKKFINKTTPFINLEFIRKDTVL